MLGFGDDILGDLSTYRRLPSLRKFGILHMPKPVPNDWESNLFALIEGLGDHSFEGEVHNRV